MLLTRPRWVIALFGALGLGTITVINAEDFDAQLPNQALRRPIAEEVPISFVSRGLNAKEWDQLKSYFNETTETTVDPATGKKVERKAIKIKLPLGLNIIPQVPPENPMTLSKWELGKKLYFDAILCSDNTVSCSSCHSPTKGFSDESKTSKGIEGKLGGMNAPTVMNSAYNRLQFWDGRAGSLEEQAQGPPQNPVEMFDGKGIAWHEAVKRIRASSKYKGLFEKEFGHEATRDAVAKAIATYERTVLVGNSISDRADLAARQRAEEEESNKFDALPKDYEKVLKEAFANKDKHSLAALKLDLEKDQGKIADIAKSISNGKTLFVNKARCNSCHVGETFTDHTFHNLGVGVKDGKLPKDDAGRFGSLPTGHKDPGLYGAFKTPQLRGLLASKPYMHDGSEKTLEEVVDFYDKGGNANEYLDSKMRDIDAEKAYVAAKSGNGTFKGPEPTVFTKGGWPIIPLKLNLTPTEKADLVNYMRSLEGEPINSLLLK